MKKQPAKKDCTPNPNYNPNPKYYMLYVTTDFYSRNGIQVYYDYDYYPSEDMAKQVGHDLLDVPEEEGGDVIDYIVVPIADFGMPGYLLKVWYGDTRYISIDCIDAMSLLDGEMTLTQFIQKKGE